MFDRWNLSKWASLPLRLIVGHGFLEHGYAKLIKGPGGLRYDSSRVRCSQPAFNGLVTILTELLGGASVLAGAFVVMASIPMATVLLVAMFSVHLRYGFSSISSWP